MLNSTTVGVKRKMCDGPTNKDEMNLKRQKTSTNYIQRNKEALANYSCKKDSAKKPATPNMKFSFSQTPYGSCKKAVDENI